MGLDLNFSTGALSVSGINAGMVQGFAFMFGDAIAGDVGLSTVASSAISFNQAVGIGPASPTTPASANPGSGQANAYGVAANSLVAVGAFETAGALTEGTMSLLEASAVPGAAPLTLPAAAISGGMAASMFLVGFGFSYAAILESGALADRGNGP